MPPDTIFYLFKTVTFFVTILQTLSSLALVFALHHYKPTPLYVMDEIDAALGTFYLLKPVSFVANSI